MPVLPHLRKCSFRAVLRDSEKQRIQRSIATVNFRLRKHFRKDILRTRVFGSYARGTLLPRKIDIRSDIDIMVQFADNKYTPQTYLDQLRRFTEANYQKSEVFQSNPTIVLVLNHIKIELVPAIKTFWSGLQIPAPASDFTNWIETQPDEFTSELQEKNKRTGSNMKPLIRLAKYWNASNGYVYPSYELEQKLVSHWYWGKMNLKDYFFSAMESLELGWTAAKWKHEKLERMNTLIEGIQEAERHNNIDEADRLVELLLPRFW